MCGAIETDADGDGKGRIALALDPMPASLAPPSNSAFGHLSFSSGPVAARIRQRVVQRSAETNEMRREIGRRR